MKPYAKFKLLIALLLIGVNAKPLLAQSKADISDPKVPITWLGVDYSQTKIIGSAHQFKEMGEISNEDFRYRYTAGWNQLFIDEQKKYDVAKAVHRASVKYAIDVTRKANDALKKDFFSNNPGDFKKITEQDIAGVVKNYDFQGNDGIGLIFFVEGISKSMESESIWVTFVDMKSKRVLQTTYKTAKPGGFGFRNYWAKPLYTILKEM
jgi:hypothetical protein